MFFYLKHNTRKIQFLIFLLIYGITNNEIWVPRGRELDEFKESINLKTILFYRTINIYSYILKMNLLLHFSYQVFCNSFQSNALYDDFMMFVYGFSTLMLVITFFPKKLPNRFFLSFVQLIRGIPG